MNNLLIFKSIGFLISFFVLIFSLKHLPRGKARILFSAMITLFFLSTIFYFEEGVLNEWFEHLPFYAAQLFFYLFISRLINETVFPSDKKMYFFLPFFAIFNASGVYDFIVFLTAQGVQHIVVFPITVITIIALQARQIAMPLNIRKISLTLFFSGLGVLSLIHTAEFFIESQSASPLLSEGAMEGIEFILFYAGILLFYAGARYLSQGQSDK